MMSKNNFKKKVKGALKWGQKKYEEYQAGKVKARERRTETMKQSTQDLKSQIAYERAQNELARVRSERRKITAPSMGGMGGGDINSILFGGPATRPAPIAPARAVPVKKKYKYYTKRILVRKAPKRKVVKYRMVKRRVIVRPKQTRTVPVQPSQPSIVDMI